MTTMGIIGADWLPIEEMGMSTNEKSSNPALQPRVPRFTRILSTGGSFHQIRTFINTSSKCRCSGPCRRMRPASELPMDGMYTGENPSPTLSLSTRTRAL